MDSKQSSSAVADRKGSGKERARTQLRRSVSGSQQRAAACQDRWQMIGIKRGMIAGPPLDIALMLVKRGVERYAHCMLVRRRRSKPDAPQSSDPALIMLDE